jgi:hypothetical protein
MIHRAFIDCRLVFECTRPRKVALRATLRVMVRSALGPCGAHMTGGLVSLQADPQAVEPPEGARRPASVVPGRAPFFVPCSRSTADLLARRFWDQSGLELAG